jgi:hypothetical protein
MAFKKTIISQQGFGSVDAYHRVECVALEGKTNISFKLRAYKDVTFPFFNEKEFNCSYDLDGDNPIKQAYKFIRKTDEYKDAVDC